MTAQPRRESVFLVLAPEKSEGFPEQSAAQRSASPSSISTSASVDPASLVKSAATDASLLQQTVVITEKQRRSSSVSSNGSSKRGFLKLGPVHFGGDPLEPDFVSTA